MENNSITQESELFFNPSFLTKNKETLYLVVAISLIFLQKIQSCQNFKL